MRTKLGVSPTWSQTVYWDRMVIRLLKRSWLKMSLVQTSHLERRPTRSGQERTFIAGTRISVQLIYVEHELWGRSPDEIVADYPHLSLPQVHAALSYCYEHLDEMRREYREDQEFVEEARSKHGPGPLARKLKSDGNGDPVSS